MNKKASGGVVIAIIIIAVIIIGVVVLLYFLNEKGYLTGDNEVNGEDFQIRAVFKAVDAKDKDKTIGAIYSIYDYFSMNDQIQINPQIILKQGILSKGETREEKLSSIPLITCYSEDYYLATDTPDHSFISQNLSKIGIVPLTCKMEEIEKNLQVSHTEQINGEISILNLTISSEMSFQRISVCPAWSSGFVSVKIEESKISCDSGSWLNYTYFNATSNTYNYLSEGEYVCGNEIEKCKRLEQGSCTPQEERPQRLNNRVDFCQDTGITLNGNSVGITVTVESSNYITRNDHIDFYIYDEDRRYDSAQKRLTWVSEFNGEDIGAEDVIYTINYEGEQNV